MNQRLEIVGINTDRLKPFVSIRQRPQLEGLSDFSA